MKTENNFKEIFDRCMRENGLERFAGYSDVFFGITEKLTASPVNVTAIKNEEDIVALHYADSLLGERFLPENSRCVDVGAGGGFPSLPLAAVRKDIVMTALDSTEKKLAFVADTAAYCGIGNIKTLHARAEEAFAYGEKMRESFDCATARAVAPLNMLCELCLPAVKVGGRFIAYRGADGQSELEAAGQAINKNGGEISEVFKTELISPSGKNQRHIIVIEKIHPTDKHYPRKFSLIKKHPL